MGFPVKGVSFKTNNFDFIRLLLAFLVLGVHSVNLSQQAVGYNAARREQLSTLAVDCFFLLSGYLITASWAGSLSLLDFMLKRVKRIFPAFIVVGIICNFVVAPLASHGHLSIFQPQWVAESVVRTLTLHGFYSNLAFVGTNSVGRINGSLWTVRYEFLCYCMIALIGLLEIFRRPAILIAFTIFLMSWWIWLHHHSINNKMYLRAVGDDDRFPRFFTSFMLGTLFYLFRARIKNSIFIAGGFLVVALIGHFMRWSEYPLFYTLILTYPVMYFAYASWIPLQHFGRWGDFSYGVYIWAWPIQALLVMYFPALKPSEVFIYSGIITLLFGFASWHLVEKWFLKKRHSSERSHHVVDPASELGTASPNLEKPVIGSEPASISS